jgi:hypothetical protein
MSDDTKFLEPGALENILIGAYDTFVEENVGIRAKAGLTVSITREALGGCCEWCSKLAGTYPYGEEPKEIYQKHDNCTCMVIAKTDKGYTDIWSKKQYQTKREARENRIRELALEQGTTEKHNRLRRMAKNRGNEFSVQADLKDFEYMSKSFRPKYGATKTFTRNVGVTKKAENVILKLKKVENSNFEMYVEQSFTKREKIVRLAEKSMRTVSNELPIDFKTPRVLVIDFDKHKIRDGSIAAYNWVSGDLFINSKYDTEEKISGFLKEKPGQFASTDILSPYRHELGHALYWDEVKAIAKQNGIRYNAEGQAKLILDTRIQEFVHKMNDEGTSLEHVSSYAWNGYKYGSYGEVLAECYASRFEKEYSMKLLEYVMEKAL